jgi:catechol 2,3-dioxygenase-like lactoylglutathione lyase family enzyme
MAGQGFHHVAIRAIDFDATLKFYAEGLGCSVHFEFSVPGRIDRAAFLDMGDGRYIEVFGPASTVQSEGRRRRPEEEPTEGALLHFCFRVDDVEAAYSRALTAGAVSRIAPMTAQLVGGEIAFVTGPNGEVIEFLRSEKL